MISHQSKKDAIPPHPVLSSHYGTQEQRVGYIRHLFDTSASSYDRINDWMSLRTGERYRLDALRRVGIKQGQSVLDIACGTGVMAMHEQTLVGPQGKVIAIDPSIPMLRQAATREVHLRAAGTAERLPLPDRCIDMISMGYALRHVSDLRLAFAEFLRVLKPGGQLLILEMVPPDSRIGYGFTKLYLKYLVPGVTSMVTRNKDARRLMEYYWETVDQCVPPNVVLAALADVGFGTVDRSIQLGIMSEYTATKVSVR